MSRQSRRCVAPNCYIRGKENVSLFTFSKDPAKREAWLKALNLSAENVPSSWRVCATHFGTDAWEKTREDGTRRLKENAVPTLFQPSPAPASSIPEVPPPLKRQDHSYCSTPVLRSTPILPQNFGSQSLSVVRSPLRDASNRQQTSDKLKLGNTAQQDLLPARKLFGNHHSDCASAINDKTPSQPLTPRLSNLHYREQKTTSQPIFPQPLGKNQTKNTGTPGILSASKICGDCPSGSTRAIIDETPRKPLGPRPQKLLQPKRICHATLPKPPLQPAPENTATQDLSPTREIRDDRCFESASAANDETPSQSLGRVSSHSYPTKPKRTSELIPILPTPPERLITESTSTPDISPANNNCGVQYSEQASAIHDQTPSQSLGRLSDHLYSTKPKRPSELIPILPKPPKKTPAKNTATPDLSSASQIHDRSLEHATAINDETPRQSLGLMGHLCHTKPNRTSELIPILPKPPKRIPAENTSTRDISLAIGIRDGRYFERAAALNFETPSHSQGRMSNHLYSTKPNRASEVISILPRSPERLPTESMDTPAILPARNICDDHNSETGSAFHDETPRQPVGGLSDHLLYCTKPKRPSESVSILPKVPDRTPTENTATPDLSPTSVSDKLHPETASAINDETPRRSLGRMCDHLYSSKPKLNSQSMPILPKRPEKPAVDDTVTPDLSPGSNTCDGQFSESANALHDEPSQVPGLDDTAAIPCISPRRVICGDRCSESASAINKEVATTSGNGSLKNLTYDELMAIIEEKNRVIADQKETVQKLTNLTEKLYHRVDGMKRTNACYRKKLKRLADSNISSLLNVRSKLRKDQITALGRKSTKGMKWTPETVRDALVYKMRMGSRAYADFVQKMPIYPSIRTVQESIKHIDFDSGILYDVFRAVKEDVSLMPSEMRRCILGGDEMAIQEAEIYDPGSKKMIGKATFEPHSGLAKKAFTIVVGGVAKRFKFTGAYCFTSAVDKTSGKRKKTTPDENPVGEALKKMVFDVVVAAETIAGLFCDAYVCDMGPDNLALWRAVNVGVSGNDRRVTCSVPHPCRPNERFWFLPDTVHLFKNIANSLCINQFFRLSDDVVEEYGLRCGEVRLQHLQELLDHEKSFELKIAHRLHQDNLESKRTFNKMKVTNATAIFSKRTEVGLREKAKRENTDNYDATIFFLALVVHWFNLVTNRGAKLRLSPDNEEEYRKALEHIQKTAAVFRTMTVGKDSRWKPIQTGMLVACEALLQIQDMYLVEQKILKFLLLGRITQDFVENLYSLLRFRLSVPNALHFKWNLRVVTLAQICLTAMNSNYFRDTDEDVLLTPDFIAATKKVAEARAQERADDELMEGAAISVPEVSETDIYEIDSWEWPVIYFMAGAVVRSLKKMKLLSCDVCFKSLLWQEEKSHPCAAVVELLEYKEGVLFSVTETCFKATLKAELTFRRLRETLSDVDHVNVVEFLVENLKYVWDGANLPTCHDVGTKYLRRFITMRFQTYGLMRRKEIRQRGRKVYASKTMAMHTTVV